MKELVEFIKARYPIIWIQSYEEERVFDTLAAYTLLANKEFWYWSRVSGLAHAQDGDNLLSLRQRGDAEFAEPDDAIGFFHILEKKPNSNGAILLMADLHHELESITTLPRMLRETAQQLRLSKNTLVVVAPTATIPADLRKDVRVMDFPLPDRALLTELVAASVKKVRAVAQQKEIVLTLASPEEVLAEGLLGLTYEEAKTALMLAAVKAEGKDIPIAHILAAKKEIIRESGALEFIDPPPTDYFRGYDLLRGYLRRMHKACSPRAAKAGIEYPKGLFLVSPPGCGKSMVTKLVGLLWGQPVIRLNIGSLFGSLVGESEANLNRAIQLAEAVAPCILQLDEVEKGFGGTSNGGDSGTSARVLGRFLTWMQEKTAPVIVMATANDIHALPPEFMRKGRFDELFLMDLPNAAERTAIFRAHLHKRGKKLTEVVIAALVQATRGYSGAEIEQMVKEGMLIAFDCDEQLSAAHIQEAVKDTVPLSVTMETQIKALQQWGQRHARRASRPEVPPAPSTATGALEL